MSQANPLDLGAATANVGDWWVTPSPDTAPPLDLSNVSKKLV